MRYINPLTYLLILLTYNYGRPVLSFLSYTSIMTNQPGLLKKNVFVSVSWITQKCRDVVDSHSLGGVL